MSSVSLLRQRRSTSLSVVTAPPPSSLVISVRRAIEIQQIIDQPGCREDLLTASSECVYPSKGISSLDVPVSPCRDDEGIRETKCRTNCSAGCERVEHWEHPCNQSRS
ncbi:hypothetical protein IGI04_036926 [Brassica rapa subsp. trilocularis]|uniref:Uncharacterized protein n=1 Tax=Brassica rapa subsp. trilocularis TaxID=1813537 RepID=A0ABQ7LFW5_BRACM|nr:hypothetical protein IGI04_036926 [Brassica rapa subsp. trilocularis]